MRWVYYEWKREIIKEGASGKAAGCSCPLHLIPTDCRWCLEPESSTVLRGLLLLQPPLPMGKNKNCCWFFKALGRVSLCVVLISPKGVAASSRPTFVYWLTYKIEEHLHKTGLFYQYFAITRTCTVWNLHRLTHSTLWHILFPFFPIICKNSKQLYFKKLLAT